MSRNLPNDIGQLLEFVSRLYSYRISEYGPVANGVFWKDADAQVLRLELLLEAIAPEDLNGPITINDLGCGYGALFDLVKDDPMMLMGRYFGYDISPEMIRTANKRTKDPRASFTVSPVATETADYAFVSGTYNMSMDADRTLWTDYIQTSLGRLWQKTTKAMAFNLLEDTEPHKLDDLYYADRRTFVEYALTLSPEVEIVDDYPLNEFTILVRRS